MGVNRTLTRRVAARRKPLAGGAGLRPAPRTFPRQTPHTGRTAQRPPVRALCAAIPARSPLLPALTRSLRAASVFLTSPPHKAERARSGTLQLYYTSKQTGGGTNPETHWGRTRNPPPAPLTARFHVLPQTPTPASPKSNDGPRRTNNRGKRKAPQSPPRP